MKVELTPTQPKEKQFEPFSVTFTFETEQEACDMWHRINSKPVVCESPTIKHPYRGENLLTIHCDFSKIMQHKGLKKP